MMKFKINFFILAFLLIATVLPAADRYWIATTTANWNSTANWSTSDGGASGASVPGSGDIARFTSTRNGNCSVNAAVNVAGIIISTYTGTITQGSVKMVVGSSGFTQQAGTFTESTDSLIVNGTFSKSAGTFNAAGKLCFRGDVSVIGGTFNAGTSQANINGTRTFDASGVSFYDFFFVPNASNGCTISVSNDFTVTDTLKYAGTTNSITVNGSGKKINATGHVKITNTVTGGGGSATINISGSASKSLIGNGTSLGGALGKVIIDKTSGTLTLSNTTTIAGDLTYTSGTISAGSSTIMLTNNASNSITVAGSFTVANLSLNPSASLTVTVSNTVTVSSSTTFTGGSNNLIVNTGTIAAKGNISASNTATGSGGNATLSISGTTDQDINTGGSTTGGFLPNVTINNPSHTIYMQNDLTIGGNLTLTAGTLNCNDYFIYLKGDWTNNGATFSSGLGQVNFVGSGTQTIGGSTTTHGFYFFKVDPSATYTLAITSGHTVSVQDYIMAGGSNNISVNTGTISCLGSVTVSNTGTGSGGTGTVLMNHPSAAQTITGNGGITSGFLPNLTINKTSGTVTLAATTGIAGNLTLTSGGFSASTFGLGLKGDWVHNSGTFSAGTGTVTFIGSGTQTVSGSATSHSLYNFKIDPTATYTLAITSGHTITASNSFTVAGSSSNVTINTGTIACTGSVTVTNTGSGSGGSGTILINGSGTQAVAGNGTTNSGFLPNVELNKSAGTASVSATLGVGGNLTLTAGTISIASAPIALKKNFIHNGATLSGGGVQGLIFVGSGKQIVSGSTTTHNTALTINPSATDTIEITSGHTIITGTGGLTISGGSNNVLINTGTIECSRNITITNTGTGSGGTGTININGTTSQNITGNGGISSGFLPNVELNKSSGTATLLGSLGIAGNLLLTAGTLDASTFTLGVKGNWTHNGATFTPSTGTVSFIGSGTQTIGGSTTSHSMYNLTIDPTATYTLAITSGHTVTASNTLTIAGGSNSVSINTGTLASTGSITVTNSGAGSGGSGTLLINGTGTQTITGNGGITTGFLPNVELNKSSGTATLGASTGIAGNLLLTAGTLNASTFTLGLKGNWTHNGATFTPSTSTVTFIGSGTQTVGGSTTAHSLYNFKLDPTATYTLAITSGHTITASNSFTVAGSSNNVTINTGTIACTGSVTVTNTGSGSGGSGTVLINGSGAQSIIGNGGITNGFLPNVEISNSGSTATVTASVGIAGNLALTAGTLNGSSNTIGLKGNWTHNGATFTSSTGTVTFIGSGTQTVDGSTTSHSLYNFKIDPTSTYTLAITSGHTITASNSFTVAGSSNNLTINTGTIACTGSVTVTNTGSGSGGSGTILLSGSNAQSIVGNGTSNSGFLPNMEVNKSSNTASVTALTGVGNLTLTSGTLSLGSGINIAVKGNFTQNGATFSTGLTSGLLLVGSGKQIIDGSTTSHSMGGLTINPTGTDTVEISTGHTIVTGLGGVSIQGGSNNIRINTGTIICIATLTVSNTGSGTGGTGTIEISGAGASHNITGNGGITNGFLPNLVINKSSGTVNIAASVGVEGNLTLTSGTLNGSSNTIGLKGNWTHNSATFTPSTGTVSFIGSGTQTVGGSTTSHSMYNLTINPTSTYTFAITSGHTITASNLVTIAGGSNSIQINTGTIASTGSVTITNSSANSGGSGTLLINGTGAQTITPIGSLTNGAVCNVEVNKSSGTVTLADDIAIAGNLTLTAGTFSSSTFSMGLFGNWTNNGGTFSGTGTVYLKGGSATQINGSASSQSFYDLTIDKNSGIALTTGGSITTITVNRDFELSSGNFTAPATMNVTKDFLVQDNYTLGSATNIGGDWNNYGVITVGTGTVTFNGTTANQVLYADDGTENFYNLVINKPSYTLNQSSAIACDNNLTITAGTLATNNNNISLKGNWANTGGTFTPGTATVTFTGSNYVQVSKTSSTETFSNIVVNKSGGAITLGSPVAITTSAALTKGVIKSTSTNYFEFKDNATYSGGTDSSFVNGPVKKTGDDVFTFPLGDTTLSYGQFHPVRLTAPSVSTDAYMATYYDTTQSLGSGLSGCIDVLNSCEYWLIKRTAGSSNVKATIYWNNFVCYSGDSPLNTIARWNSTGSVWESMGVDDYYYTSTVCSLKTAINLPFDGSGNCYLVQATNRLQSTDMSVDIGNDTILCDNATLNLSSPITGGSSPFTYAWSPSADLSSTIISNPVASPSSSIAYVLQIMDDRNCSALDTINITVSTPITVDVMGDRNVCGGSESQLTTNVDGGYAPYIYAWTPATALSDDSIPDPIASPSSNTTYTLTITDTIGCTIADTIQMHAVSSLTVTAVSDFSVCPGEVFSLSASGADYYSWYPVDVLNHCDIAAPDGTVNDTTKFYVTGWIGDCASVDSVVVSTKTPPSLSLPSDTVISCSGGSVGISATGTGTFSWADTAQDTVVISTSSSLSVSPTTSTAYMVTLTGANGCHSNASVTVIVDTIMLVTQDSLLLREGEQIIINVLSDGTTFHWSPADGLNDTSIVSPTCNVDTTTTYTLTVYKNGCSRSETIKVWQVARPYTFFTYTYPNLAVNFTIPYAISGTTYAWDFGDGGTSTSQNPTHTFSAAGDYRVNVTVQNAFGTTVYSDLVIVRN